MILCYSSAQTCISEYDIPISQNLDPDAPFIAAIPNVSLLASAAYAFGRAIFDLKKEQITWDAYGNCDYSDLVWQNMERRKAEYRDEIKKIAEALP